MPALPVVLMAVGIVLFVAGDLAWLWRWTRNRRMDVRVTGSLIGGGALLIVFALLLLVLDG